MLGIDKLAPTTDCCTAVGLFITRTNQSRRTSASIAAATMRATSSPFHTASKHTSVKFHAPTSEKASPSESNSESPSHAAGSCKVQALAQYGNHFDHVSPTPRKST